MSVMSFRRFVSILLLSLALPVTAQITTVQLAHEVSLADVRMPGYESGTMGFKPCESCDFQTTRVSSECTWLVNNQPTSFEEFQEAVAALENRRDHYLTVLHHLEHDHITEVSIVIR